MPSFFTPETPIGRAVQGLLLGSGDGKAIHELRRDLRLQGLNVSEGNLRELLSDTHHFVVLSNDRYCLREQLRAPAQKERSDPRPAKPMSEPPLIVNLPTTLNRYIILDLETTGVDREKDRIVQIVAICFEGTDPVGACNYYLNPAPRPIPYDVQLKLGLDRHPEIMQAIHQGATIEAIADDLRGFLGDLPIVAHNARFDRGFLIGALGELPNPFVDSMELATLVRPDLTNHRLETLFDALDVKSAEAAEIWQRANGPKPLAPIDTSTLHNAITDTCLLALVFQRLRGFWLKQDSLLDELRLALIPEAFGGTWTGDPPDVTQILQGRPRPPLPQVRSPEPFLAADGAPEVEAVLEHYRAAREFPNRPGQGEMARLTWEAFEAGEFKMIEAPTGTGKTIAYLIPAVLMAARSGERVVLSTAYMNLQDQLLGEIETLRRATGLPFRFQVLKGKANYVCLRALARYIADLDVRASVAERFVVLYLLTLALVTEDCTIDQMSYWCQQTFGVTTHVIAAVTASAAGCSDQTCRTFACPIVTSSANAATAHLVIVNHALWLAESSRLPSFRYLVLDEAHTLEDQATSALTDEVSSETFGNLLDRLHDTTTGRGALVRLLAQTSDPTIAELADQLFVVSGRLRALVADFGRHLLAFLRACGEQPNPRYGISFRLEAAPWRIHPTAWTRVDGARNQLFDVYLGELRRLIAEMIRAVTADTELPYRDQSIGELTHFLDDLVKQTELQQTILRVPSRRNVYWIALDGNLGPDAADADQSSSEIEDSAPDWALKVAPIRVDEGLQERYEELTGAVFVSATLSIRGGDFSFFADRLGLTSRLGPHGAQQIQGDLDYDRNAFLGLVNYLEYTPVERTMRSFQEEFCKELQLLLDFMDGRALVLFTARARMEEAFRRVEPGLVSKEIPVFLQRANAGRRQVQQDFTERTNSVLFGLRSFWEGVDVPGESLSFVLMEKLPFPFPFDPIWRARREEVADRGGHEFNDYLFPLMAIQFKQGFGRLLRRRDDRGAVLLLDKRIHRKAYKQELLASLPGFMPRNEETERHRRAFYQTIIDSLPGVIDIDAKRDLLASLPDDLTLDLVARLDALGLPKRIEPAEYPAWRSIIVSALHDVFHHKDFRSTEQEEVVRSMLAGDDVLALMPTGSGKSLCFQLTALLRHGVTLVFSPLIALMRDQVQSLNERGIEIVAAVYSGQAADEREETFSRIRNGKVRLVYISPERLRDPQLLAALRDAQITQVVVDEAHCVAMWGPSFRPDFLYLPRLFEALGRQPPLAAFTATATPEIRNDIVHALAMRRPRFVLAPFDRPELRFIVYNTHSRYNRITSRRSRFDVLMKLLEAADRTRESVIIYVTTTVEAELLARRLKIAGHDARAYHGKMPSAERDSVQELFMDDHINIVVCTKAFGMGIDKQDVRYVIHYNMPGDLESYYQEAGRAGRDGAESYCILLYHRSDRDTHDYFIESAIPDEGLLNRLIAWLRSQPSELVYCDATELAQQLDLDEVQMKVALHLLEQAGFLTRGADFTIRGSLVLQRSIEEIDGLLAAVNPVAANLLRRAADLFNWPVYTRVEIDLLAIASKLGTPAEALDGMFIELAMRQFALYRPWERGYIITKGPRLQGDNRYVVSKDAAAHSVLQTAKLTAMIRYAEAGERSACRRSTILQYFGEATRATSCGACDICATEYEYPWSRLMARDVGGLAAYLDLGFVVLEAIKWNTDRGPNRRNPISTRNLIHVLAGDTFSLIRGIDDPARRRQRMRTAQSCPYWSAFSTLPKRDETIAGCIDRLGTEGYISENVVEFMTADGPRTYRYPALLEKGSAQLLRGEFLNW